MKLIATRVPATLLLLVVASAPAFGSLVVFSAQDTGAGPGDPHPNSTAAAASFDAAAVALPGSVSLITFESAPVGTYTNLTIAPGVSISGASYLGANQSINNSPNFPTAPSLDGFNTTAGGANYAEILGGTLTFTFATPIQYFGAYFTGVQTFFFNDVVQFSDGSTQSISVPGVGTSNTVGALDFVGFTDAGKSISSITINAGNVQAGADAIGIDDVRVQAVPEPATMTVVLGGILLATRRKTRVANG